MSIPIDDDTYAVHRTRSQDEVKNGNPGRPQSDYENPPDGPSDEPPDGSDRGDGQYSNRPAD